MIKQVITTAGKIQLNTETAEIIGSGISGKGQERSVETLYQSPHGIYFLCGTGGSLTRWENRRDIRLIEGKALIFWAIKHKLKKTLHF